MQYARRRFQGKSCATLVWTLMFFLAVQAGLGLHLYRNHPDVWDPEFYVRYRHLRARLAEAPNRPLALALGSSRVAFGFRPAAVTGARPRSDRDPVLYNFALLGCGPVRELLVLRRLLRWGVRPDWLFIEVWPPFLPHQGFYCEENLVFKRDIYWSDVAVLARLYRRPWDAFSRLVEEVVTPGVHYRIDVLDQYAPFLLPRDPPIDFLRYLSYAQLDGSGWLPAPVPPGGVDTQHAHSKSVTQPILEAFTVNPISRSAMEDLLKECRADHIKPVLVLLPEQSALRSWYPAPKRAALEKYLQEVSEEHRVPVIDARDWIADNDFADFCHLLPRGADTFSGRFGRDVYQPLLEGRPLEDAVLLTSHKY
jgi:hypothetical protein